MLWLIYLTSSMIYFRHFALFVKAFCSWVLWMRMKYFPFKKKKEKVVQVTSLFLFSLLSNNAPPKGLKLIMPITIKHCYNMGYWNNWPQSYSIENGVWSFFQPVGNMLATAHHLLVKILGCKSEVHSIIRWSLSLLSSILILLVARRYQW